MTLHSEHSLGSLTDVHAKGLSDYRASFNFSCVSSAPVSAPKVENGNKEEQPKQVEGEDAQKPAPAVVQPNKGEEQQDKPVAVTPPVKQNNAVKEVKPVVKVETPVAVVDVKKEEQPKKEEGAVKKGTYDAKASYY